MDTTRESEDQEPYKLDSCVQKQFNFLGLQWLISHCSMEGRERSRSYWHLLETVDWNSFETDLKFKMELIYFLVVNAGVQCVAICSPGRDVQCLQGSGLENLSRIVACSRIRSMLDHWKTDAILPLWIFSRVSHCIEGQKSITQFRSAVYAECFWTIECS